VNAVRERVLASLAAQTDERLATWARLAGPPPSYEAYREFVAGRAAWPDYARALGHFERAAALDSTYDIALLEVATAHRMMGACEKTDSVSRIVLSRERALAHFDRLFMEQQLAMCTGDLQAAYQRAIEMRRLAPESLWMAYNVLLQANDLNRPREALAAVDGFDLARGAAEVGPTFYYNVALVLHRLGRDERALEVAKLGRRLLPSAPIIVRAQIAVLAGLGRTREVLAGLDTLVALATDENPVRSANFVAMELRAHGHRDAATAALRRSFGVLEARAPAERAATAYLLQLGRTQYAAERWPDAAATFRAVVARDSTKVDHRGSLGVAAARVGDRATAEAQAAWLAGATRPFEERSIVWQTRIAALLGERDRAVALARQALARYGYGDVTLHWRIDADSLRGYPPFEELMRPKG
jgi:tetratricopeptide (TPR) repeat protein